MGKAAVRMREGARSSSGTKWLVKNCEKNAYYGRRIIKEAYNEFIIYIFVRL